MGILNRIKNLITGKGWTEDRTTIDDMKILEPTSRTATKTTDEPKDEEIPTGIQEGDQTPKTEKQAIDEMIQQTRKARSVRSVEKTIDTRLLNETQTRPIHIADVTPNLRGTYDTLLKGKVTDERLKEDIIIHREKLLRYRTTATVTLIGYDTTKEKPQQAREIGIILISNILPEEETALSHTLIGLTGSIPHIISQATGQLSGTRIGNIQIINSTDGSNWTITDMNIIWSMA